MLGFKKSEIVRSLYYAAMICFVVGTGCVFGIVNDGIIGIFWNFSAGALGVILYVIAIIAYIVAKILSAIDRIEREQDEERRRAFNDVFKGPYR
jgi:hypothetical protein